jgi:tetratricopeptide (TPR) repeat protein
MIRERQRGLRIKLHIDPEDPSLARLASLPWELMYRKETRDFLNLSRYTPILRYLDVQRPYVPLPLQPPLHILVVISSPWDQEALDLAREQQQIQESWAQQEGVAVDFLPTATITQLGDTLAEKTYHVLHYMGHGAFDRNTGQGVLILEDEQERGVPVDGTTLGILLRDVPSLRLVFLNACETARVTKQVGLDPFAGVAAAMVMAGIPAVVAMQFPITDIAAIRFANRFYPLLARGEPVDYAVAEGRRAIRLSESGTQEWATPVLFMRAPQGVIFRAIATPKDQGPLPEVPELPQEVDEELEKRLEQLYISGLSAFWLEEWDKACHSFAAITAARPEYRDAASKLEEARRKKELAGLYAEAQAARQEGAWDVAVAKLGELVGQKPDYRDAVALLELARRQKQLAELYAQARQLHRAAQWQAVINVFGQIAAVEPSYPDPEDLQVTAEQAQAELERQARLEEMYGRAVLEMEARRWAEAHQILNQVLEMEPGYREAERLFQRTEAELAQLRELRKRQEKVSGFYEQAATLARSRQWQQVLDRMDEIQALDPSFDDPQGLTARAQAELERQDRRESLYQQAEAAWQAEDWPQAIRAFETLLAEAPDYGDASARLQAAKKKRDLSDLYTQAREAHHARQWQSVLDTFAQLAALDPDYADPEGLLSSAQEHLVEQERQLRLEDRYGRALQAMEVGHWAEAHRLLTQIQETEPDFRDTEPLLSKAQAEVDRVEAERERQERVATYYEEAVGLARARQWRQALAKVNEIRALDSDFADPDDIAAKAQAQISHAKEEAQRQEELATLYTEAVRLLKAEQYREALQKWGEVQALDARYPDRKKVQATAKKKLRALERGLPTESRLALWIEQAKTAPNRWGRALSTRSWVLLGTAVLAVLAILIAVLLLVNPSALPQTEPILVTSNRDGKTEVYRLTNLGLERLTQSPGATASWSPATAPGGSILFTSNRDGKREVYRLGENGVERLTFTPGNGESWSPSEGPGGSILFTSNRDGKREVYRLTEHSVERVTFTPGNGESWSPAGGPGGSILFTSDRAGKREIHSLTSQGEQQLTQTPAGGESWSPVASAGEAILFTSNRDGKEEVYRLSRGETIRLTSTPGGNTSWLHGWEDD